MIDQPDNNGCKEMHNFTTENRHTTRLIAGVLATIIATGINGGPLNAQTEHRQLGAHVHGHGTLNIAIENNEIAVELEAPGADIVGFEFVPKTEEQKMLLDSAKRSLKEPRSVFLLPAAAACKLSSSSVAVHHGHDQGGADAHDQGHKEANKTMKNAAQPAGSSGQSDAAQSSHSDFDVAYSFHCQAPGKVNEIKFTYFKTFPRAKELDVSVIAAKGQNKFEVTKDNMVVKLEGLVE